MDLDEEIKSREEGEIGSESREKGDLLPCSSLLLKVPVAATKQSCMTLRHSTQARRFGWELILVREENQSTRRKTLK